MSLEEVFQQLRKPFVKSKNGTHSRVVEDVIQQSQSQARGKEKKREGFTIGDNLDAELKQRLLDMCKRKSEVIT